MLGPLLGPLLGLAALGFETEHILQEIHTIFDEREMWCRKLVHPTSTPTCICGGTGVEDGVAEARTPGLGITRLGAVEMHRNGMNRKENRSSSENR